MIIINVFIENDRNRVDFHHVRLMIEMKWNMIIR